jgi:hypothetical protein
VEAVRKAEVDLARKTTAEEETKRRSIEKEREAKASLLPRKISQVIDPVKKEQQIKALVTKIDEMLSLQEKEEHEGLTAMHIAAEDGHEGVVSYLINQVKREQIKLMCKGTRY